MSLLAPWGLLLVVAAAVPLLLHLLRRRAGARVDFPALRYLLRAEREHAREVRLRNLLLMLLRVGVVVAIAVAVSRPLGWFPGIGHPPTAVAIVLDNSLSTSVAGRDGTRLATLIAAARTVVAATRADDELWLVTFDGAVTSGNAAAVSAALDAVRPLGGAGSPVAALDRARTVVRGSAVPERRLVVLTDGQATTWRPLADAPASAVRTALFVAPAPPANGTANRAIASLVVEPRVWSPRGGVRATLHARDSVSWRLLLDGQSVARGTSAPSAPIVAHAAPSVRGWRAGALELAADELRGDDTRFFAVHIGPPPAVTVVPSAGRFVAGAIASLEQGGRVRRGDAALVGAATSARPQSLLFAPLDPLDVAAANRALVAARIPWSFGVRRTGASPVVGDGLEGARALAWYALVPRGDDAADTLARVGAEPWVVAGPGYVLVASAADPAATTLPLRAEWVPWLDRVITERLAVVGGAVAECAPGARLMAPRGVDALETPAGALLDIRAGEEFGAPWEPGVYFWRRGDARAGALVVNAEPAESLLDGFDVDSLVRRVGAVSPTENAGELAATVFDAGGRRLLDGTLLALALLLLTAELVVARRVRSPRSET